MTHKILLIATALLTITCSLRAQTVIPQSNYTIQTFSSDNPTTPITNAFDGDISTHWAIFNSAGFSLPAIVEIDLGVSYDINGFGYTPNQTNLTRKAVGYEIYLSDDGINWGTSETIGDFAWSDASDVSQKDIFFGAISARYVRVVYTSNNATDTDNTHTAELVFYESTTAATGQANQTISFTPIAKQSSTASPLSLSATASSGLSAFTYSVVSGPATLAGGNTLTLTGTAGTVTLKAEQAGDASYYPAETFQQFDVVDLSTYDPVVTTRLTEDYALEMPSLYAYPIYINSSIDEPTFLSIDHVEVDVNGTTVPVSDNNGFYHAYWTPDAYGTHTVSIKSVGTNGNETTISRTIEVTNTIADQTVPTMDEVVIINGGTNNRWYYGTHTMPQHVGSYDEIVANLLVECPPVANGCDDWDRRANIDVLGPDGNWIQIIRYITPYGVACSHAIDVTDYASLLQGEIEFRMYIDTWGTGGWQISLDFDHQQGTPTYLYSQVDELWDGVWDLGNPTDLQPVDTIQYTYQSNILSSHMRLSTTGHGWGSNNSQNAAEFYDATNFIDIDGNQEHTQNLWNDCNPNPDNCTGQLGTWTYNRAGWCPGAIAPPNIFDMTSYISTQPLELTYRFDPTYVDYCHPDDINCVTGTTCPDCNDGFKAVYHIDGQLINYSNTPLVQGSADVQEIDNTLTYDVSVYPNPSSGIFQISSSNLSGASRVFIERVSGESVKTYYFKSLDELNNFSFDLSELSSGIYFVSVENNAGQGVSRIVIQ